MNAIDELEYFMGMADWAKKPSKDPSTKVGAVIITPNKRLLSSGFNGMVAGADESELWEPRSMKLLTVLHAEENAILFAEKAYLPDHSMYCTHAPCIGCLRLILQKGIRRVFYRSSELIKKADLEENIAVQRLIKATKAEIVSATTGKKLEDEIEEHIRPVDMESTDI